MNEEHNMETDRQRVVLITGGSSGIGKACAHHLHGKGYKVYGTSRLAQWPSDEPMERTDPSATFQLIPMDVISDESVNQGVRWVFEREGHIDVVVNCAGYGIAGAVEDTELGEAKAQMETNFFGTMRLCRAVLPIMRQQGGGYLASISSIGGLIGLPFQGLYSASKFALEGLMESLRAEVKPYGIRVVLIEPGDFHTGFTANRRKTNSADLGTIYSTRFAKALGVMEADEMRGPSPEKVGYLLERIITKKSPRLRYTAGPVSEKVAAGLKRILPSGLFQWAIMMYYRLH
jgi:NAD(P)-dependent dehydrogenase (short-subunit alcohol dehydrogenase family)